MMKHKLMFVEISPSRHSDYGEVKFIREGVKTKRAEPLEARHYKMLCAAADRVTLDEPWFGVTLWPKRKTE